LTVFSKSSSVFTPNHWSRIKKKSTQFSLTFPLHLFKVYGLAGCKKSLALAGKTGSSKSSHQNNLLIEHTPTEGAKN